jgi:outer membrane usher protein
MKKISFAPSNSKKLLAWGVWGGLCVLAPQAWALTPTTSTSSKEIKLSTLYWIEARTKLIDPALPLQVELSGESFAGQVLQMEQRGLVVYEQKLPEGSFRLLASPTLMNNALLVIKVKSPNQPDKSVDLPMKSSEKRALYSERPELLALAPTTIPMPLGAQLPNKKLDEDIEFEMDFLKGKAFRNLTPLDVKRLGGTRPGNVDADVYRNGRMVSKNTVKFMVEPKSDEVRPCISPKLFQQFDVKPAYISPEGAKLLETANLLITPDNCLFLDQWVAGASSEFDPADLRLEITIAQAFLSRPNRQSVPPEMLSRGENAGFINYNLNNYNTKEISSNFLGLQSGVNVAGWQLRYSSYVSQSITSTSKTSQFVSGSAYVKRPLLDLKSNLVLGNISTNSPIIGSTPIRGARITSEEGMLPDEERSYRPIIKGVARTNARVRVTQNNVVLFEQTVPPGPFLFEEINPISSVGNLQVVIAEADGSQQTFVVPYSQAAGKLNPGSVRYSVATGVYRNFTTTQNTAVLQAYVRYGLNEFWSPGVEILLGSQYRNVGLQANFNSKLGSLSFNSLFSNLSTDKNPSGFAQNINYATPNLGAFSGNAGLGMQSEFYKTPSAGLNLDPNALFTNDAFKYNAFAGLSMNLSSLGGVSLSVSQQRNWKDQGSQQVRLGFGTTIQRVNLGVSLDKTTFTDGTASTNSLSVSAAVPLDFLGPLNGNLRAGYLQRDSGDPSQTITYSGSNDATQTNYNLSETKSGKTSTSSAAASWGHPYGGLGVSLSSTSQGGQQYGLSAFGSMVLHEGGVLLAPNVGETFGIVEVPKGEGASLVGSNALVNSRGYGVVPNLSPYFMNDVQISLEGASSELEVENPVQRVAPVEGSIVRLKFNSTSGRPLLIVLQTSNGKPVPIGASIIDPQGNELATVGQGSRVLLRVKKAKDRLNVVWGDKPNESCFIEYALDDKKVTTTSGFTNLKLACITEIVAENNTK